MSPNKVVINDLLSFFVCDENMPELIAWLSENGNPVEDSQSEKLVQSMEEEVRESKQELDAMSREEIDWLNNGPFRQHNDAMESQDDE